MPSSDQLHAAVREGDLNGVLTLLNQGHDANQRDDNLFTPLHIAAQEGQLEIAAFLLDRGAAIGARAKLGEEPLLMAITSRWGAKADPEIVRLLVSRGANVGSMDDDGWTPLYAAAERGATKVAEVLIASGAEVDQPTSFGDTPLHRAVRRPHVETVTFLLASGADIDLPNNDGASAAQIIAGESRGPSYAGDWGRGEIRAQMGFLAQQYSGKLATGPSQRSMVESLKDAGVSVSVVYPNATSKEGVLVIAAGQGDLDTVQELLRRGISPNASIQGDITALMAVCTTPHVHVAEALLDAGANPESPDARGVTPAMGAAFAGQLAMLRLLMSRGVDISIRSKEGFSALDLAQNQGHAQVVELLRQGASQKTRRRPWWKRP